LTLNHLAGNPTIRRSGEPLRQGTCVVYWMQRSQRALDNPALDLAVEAANLLGKPVVTFFAPVPFYPHANLRHYHFLAEAIPDTAASRQAQYRIRSSPLSRSQPAAFLRRSKTSPGCWRRESATRSRTLATARNAQPARAAMDCRSDVVVPSKLLNKRFAAERFIRPAIQAQLDQFLIPSKNPKPKHAWTPPKDLQLLPPDFDILRDWPIDRAVSRVSSFRGGTT
jgi:deoxyribodipyrimidine photo-lyase